MSRFQWMFVLVLVGLLGLGCGEDSETESTSTEVPSGQIQGEDGGGEVPGETPEQGIDFPELNNAAGGGTESDDDSDVVEGDDAASEEEGDESGDESTEEEGDESTEEESGESTEEEGDESTEEEGDESTEEEGDESTEEEGEEESTETSEEEGDEAEEVPPEPGEVGEVCTLAIGCVFGASCVETEEGGIELQCYEDVIAGEVCGPGFGQCAKGSVCVEQDDGTKICVAEVSAGSDCSDGNVVCEAGTVCLPGSELIGYGAESLTIEGQPLVTNSGIAWDDSTGTLWVTDAEGGGITGYGVDGTVNVVMNLDGDANVVSGLYAADGVLWIADSSTHTIHSATAPIYFPSVYAQGLDLFGEDGPHDVTAGETGVFASCPEKNMVLKIGAAGDVLQTLQLEVTTPRGIWNWASGIWIANEGGQNIAGFDAGGLPLTPYGGPEEEKGNLFGPKDVVFSEDGSVIVVADQGGAKVVVYDTFGDVVTTISAGKEFAPAGVALSASGDTLFVLDATSGNVTRHEATYGSVCVSPSNAGDGCDPEGSQPCASGLECVEEVPGGDQYVCKGVLNEGGDCSSSKAVCAEGLECVRGNAADQHIKTCLTQVEIGQPCGPGVAGCVDGAGCNWESPLHLARTCYPDVAEGQVCNGYGAGDCVAGTSCVQTLPGDPTMICKATVDVGEPCGALAGADCNPGLSCNFATSVQDRLCFPFQKEGEPCGIGAGECVPGTLCQLGSLTALFPTCIANSGIGEECATEGKGLCNDDAECLLTSIDGPATCQEKSGLDGESCSNFGDAPCASGAECLVDEIGGNTGSCYQDEGSQNADCGVTYGWCDEAEGLGCDITNTDLVTGTCKPKASVFGACGALEEGAPSCAAATQGCTCSSPFVDYTAGYSDTECAAAGYQEVCVPEVELYDFCAVNTGLDGVEAQNGWLGFCPQGTTCSVALGIFNGEPIQASGAAATSYYFQCKMLVGAGETCGQRFACDTGYECQCSPGTLCTPFENMTGDLGTCQLATP